MKRPMEPLESMCKELEEDLVLYYYGELGDVEKRRMAQHLNGCGGCRRFIDDLNHLLPQVVTAPELSQSFWDNYYRETVAKLDRQREQRDWWRNLFVPMRIWMLPAFGTAAVAALALTMILGKGNLSFLYSESQDALPRAIVADRDQLEFFKSMDMLESLGSLEGFETPKDEAHST